MLGGLKRNCPPAKKASQCPRVSGNLTGRSSPHVPPEILKSPSHAGGVCSSQGSEGREGVQGAALMSKFGVNVPRGILASTPAEAAAAARELAPDGGEVLEALPSGGRQVTLGYTLCWEPGGCEEPSSGRRARARSFQKRVQGRGAYGEGSRRRIACQ